MTNEIRVRTHVSPAEVEQALLVAMWLCPERGFAEPPFLHVVVEKILGQLPAQDEGEWTGCAGRILDEAEKLPPPLLESLRAYTETRNFWACQRLLPGRTVDYIMSCYAAAIRSIGDSCAKEITRLLLMYTRKQ